MKPCLRLRRFRLERSSNLGPLDQQAAFGRWTLYVLAREHSFDIDSVCVYSNSRNDIPRVAQRYGATAAHTRRRASVFVVFVVFCVHMHSFAGLIRHGYPGLLDRKNHSDMCPRWESNPRLPAYKASTLFTTPGSPLLL